LNSSQISGGKQTGAAQTAPRRSLRLLILLLGILLGQAILYGPSLTGSKILLPLDLLAMKGAYIPRTPETARIIPHNPALSDLVDGESHRRFFSREFRSGRMPHWYPCQYAGAPINTCSPFVILSACFESPKILPWVHMLTALVAGSGAYLFCRRVLQLAFRSAVLAAWCYPLTAFFVLWQGYTVEFSTVWLPWVLFGVDRAVRRPGAKSIAGLGIATALTLVSGQLDLAGQVLLVSGLYAVWSFLRTFYRQWFTRRALATLGAVTVGWGLGFMLATPNILPLLEYTQTGERILQREAGCEERPPIGLKALPQVAIPTLYGSNEIGSYPNFPPGQKYLQESSAAAYAGIVALLLAAPLGWCNRQRRPEMLFFAALGFLALGWTLNIPGLVAVLRLPGLSMMSHNRLVFATAFSTVAMMAMGLDALERGEATRRRWFLFPAALLGAILIWCACHAFVLPEPMQSQLAASITTGKHMGWVRTLDDVSAVQTWFFSAYFTCAVWAGIGLMGWLLVWQGKTRTSQMLTVLGAFLVGDLLWFGYGQSAQCDPSLYFPRIPALEAISHAEPGRVLGYGCLPAGFGDISGLSCIQGYDAIDPARLMDVLRLAADPHYRTSGNGWTQVYSPKMEMAPPDNVRLPPILDMLNVRYLIFRGTAPSDIQPAFQSPDYWVLVNRSALPRAFIPRRVEVTPDAKERLKMLADPQFDAREVAYVESPLSMPAACKGTVRIVDEIPSRVTVSAQMETPGLVVLADLWDKGWRAFLDGQPVPILRANHALRGVVVPSGNHALEFRYEPASVWWGMRLAVAALALIAGLFGFAAWIKAHSRS